ncbi:MAG TPA: FAD-dependent oxidoreductase [Candidatus Limnocylindria bacterium]|nr:FAD-dependent oxidoreductase [Candidatus Limnocylindria bacterium]
MRVAIVGAGVTGLVAARALLARGHAVDLYERWPDVAGQASAFDLGNGVYLDRYYHHLFESDRYMIELHEELLPGQLEWHRSTVGMYARGRIWPFTTPRDLLSYGPLPLADRVRLGLAVVRLTRRDDWERMDDISAAEWLRQACGERAYRGVWLPLLLGKFGDDAPTIPLAWLWSKLTLRRRLEGAKAGRELLGYPSGSFRAICVALADDIRAKGGRIHVDREVVAIEPATAADARDGGWRLRTAGPGAYRRPAGTSAADPALDATADLVLLTTPTHIARSLAPWPGEYLKRLDDWTYRTAVVLLLELRRPFSDTYWVNVGEADVPFLGVVEHTNLVPAERYPARYLYVSNYVAANDPLTRLDTNGLLAHYVQQLARMGAGFGEDDVMRAWSFREDAAQPIPRLGNRHRILPYATPLPGVFVANTTQIYPEDRGTNYSVRLGLEVAKAIG